MRIVTLNTWKNEGEYHARVAAMIRGLRELDADVVLLQEVFRSVDGRVDTALALGQALDRHVIFTPARRKHRPWRGGSVLSDSGLAILVRGNVGWWERMALASDHRGGERIALLAELNVRDERALVACVHLSHVRGDDRRRAEQLSCVLAHARWRGMPGVVGGDFNCTATELPAAICPPTLIARNVLGQDASPTHPLPPRPDRPGRALDQLWVVCSEYHDAPTVRAARVALDGPIDGVWPSDHAAVVADLAMPGVTPGWSRAALGAEDRTSAAGAPHPQRDNSNS